MVMGSTTKIEPLPLHDEIYICPACGYQDGFHVSFKMNDKGKNAEVYLICPNCSVRYRPGWQVVLSKNE